MTLGEALEVRAHYALHAKWTLDRHWSSFNGTARNAELVAKCIESPDLVEWDFEFFASIIDEIEDWATITRFFWICCQVKQLEAEQKAITDGRQPDTVL